MNKQHNVKFVDFDPQLAKTVSNCLINATCSSFIAANIPNFWKYTLHIILLKYTHYVIYY